LHLCIFGPLRFNEFVNEDLQKRIQDALANPQNLGELANADAVGTVGNSDCGEMLRMWVKYKQQDGKKVIDRATFQSFGCETAIAVASLATELIRGKTAEEAPSVSHGGAVPAPPCEVLFFDRPASLLYDGPAPWGLRQHSLSACPGRRTAGACYGRPRSNARPRSLGCYPLNNSSG
jgi:hypothetical protein